MSEIHPDSVLAAVFTSELKRYAEISKSVGGQAHEAAKASSAFHSPVTAGELMATYREQVLQAANALNMGLTEADVKGMVEELGGTW